jgi:hypothetical protein
MYCIYWLEDPANLGATWQLMKARSQSEFNQAVANTPSNLEVHSLLVQAIPANMVSGGLAINTQQSQPSSH